MAQGHCVDKTWMWHPDFREDRTDTAGLFVHFRRALLLPQPVSSLNIQISADTRYKLYVNGALVSFGPVKGDSRLWFYDEIDLGPFLKRGRNVISVTVLRYFFATRFAASFPRMPCGGLRITTSDEQSPWRDQIRSSPSWTCAIDPSTTLRLDEPEDDFLHIYEHTTSLGVQKAWVPAQLLEFQTSTGNSAPWNLSPRLIPRCRVEQCYASATHNVQSSIPTADWAALLLQPKSPDAAAPSQPGIHLAPFSSHQFDLELPHHVTAFLTILFARPVEGGSVMRVRYAESYEDKPRLVPYLRTKGDRSDFNKDLHGPEDVYHFRGQVPVSRQCLDDDDANDSEAEENFAPFHFRTFRFVRVNIDVGPVELVIRGIDMQSVQYPLDVAARLEVPEAKENNGNKEDDGLARRLWDTSVRTLNNCMHDCYEDCPFYEQLQYAMDTRSSCLFTYYLSADDRMARQAMVQIHNSFNPQLGLTCSRAPCHNPQIIPHFSLYWICMLDDHLAFFGDKAFLRQFVPVADAVLAYFDSLIDPSLGLVRVDTRPGIWHFTDWVEEWRPYGVPPAAERTGVSTYTNNLYAYALKKAAGLLRELGRPSVADEYLDRAGRLVRAIGTHCFDGRFFTDGLADANSETSAGSCHSQHNQVWAVLSGAASRVGQQEELLRQCLDPASPVGFVKPSISMSYYTLRGLSEVGGSLYEQHFHGFWKPWEDQLALNLTTWEEDSVSQRSDCHAWGSVPIYEFMAEVVGLRPRGPGWAAIAFQPRIGLYSELRASVPLRRDAGGRVALLAHVSWEPALLGGTVVRLRVESSGSRDTASVPIYVKLPSQPEMLMDSVSELEFRV